MFQHTATRRWLLVENRTEDCADYVSTHSHPKVAAFLGEFIKTCFICFNTQPPEGGCFIPTGFYEKTERFQHTATRRWLRFPQSGNFLSKNVSTHSHPKVAANLKKAFLRDVKVSTHSHPKVAAAESESVDLDFFCFNTQPPEGGCSLHKKARKISKLNTVFR